VWIPFALAIALLAPGAIPAIPGSDVHLLEFKSGDVAVHLVGAAAFIFLGIYSVRGPTIAEAALWPAWLLGIAMTAAISRAALLAAAVGAAAALVLKPSQRAIPFFAIALFLGASFVMADPTIDLGRHRRISVEQITSNFESVISDRGRPDLEGTESWRQRWWGDIVDYTINGPHFWAGKGFGINLADDDGFQTPDQALRSPHNAHMTILARTGVPGLAIWALLQAGFAFAMLRAFFSALARGDAFWVRVNGWLFVYWLAMMIVMTFDVYLEGPQGGIWFWSVFGLGLAALSAQASDRSHDRGGAMPARPHAHPLHP
jgi:hypothetical protein